MTSSIVEERRAETNRGRARCDRQPASCSALARVWARPKESVPVSMMSASRGDLPCAVQFPYVRVRGARRACYALSGDGTSGAGVARCGGHRRGGPGGNGGGGGGGANLGGRGGKRRRIPKDT